MHSNNPNIQLAGGDENPAVVSQGKDGFGKYEVDEKRDIARW